MNGIGSAVVGQFGRPRGLLGLLAGFIMQARPSNRRRSELTLDLLDVQRGDRVLEVGFGPGLGLAQAAERATSGKVVGVDHSDLMVRQARRRNANAIAAGRVEILLGSASALPPLQGPFDKVMAANVYMFWKDPVSVLAGLRAVMAAGGVIALTVQPRRRRATLEDSRAVASRMEASLRSAGFGSVRTEMLPLKPVPAACVLGHNLATSASDMLASNS